MQETSSCRPRSWAATTRNNYASVQTKAMGHSRDRALGERREAILLKAVERHDRRLRNGASGLSGLLVFKIRGFCVNWQSHRAPYRGAISPPSHVSASNSSLAFTSAFKLSAGTSGDFSPIWSIASTTMPPTSARSAYL